MKSKHFKIQEFVDKKTYNKFGEFAYAFIDDRIISVLHRLREDIERPIIINDWSWGGKNQWRGLRTIDSEYYSKYSQHSFGRAVDFDVKGMDAKEVREYIKEHIHNYSEIKGMEEDVNWVHIDVRNQDKFKTFKP